MGNTQHNIDIMSLFRCLCNLSYAGDVRNVFGAEDPNKVQNIITRQKKELFKTYKALFPM